MPVVWASGSNGAILRSVDSGKTWSQLHVEGGDALDFRSIRAFDERTAYVMSSGEGEKSRIYRTTDGGESWTLQFEDKRPGFFLDALVCGSPTRCFALSDPVERRFVILSANDGVHWNELPQDATPAALPEEGAFAASGTCLAIQGNDIYFVTGGPAARLFYSLNLGRVWTVVRLPIVGGSASSGAFSIAVRESHMVIVGGNYKSPDQTDRVAAYSRDAGKSWKLAERPPHGYRSAVAWLDKDTTIAVGPNGGDVSFDGGAHWSPTTALDMNALGVLNPSTIWAAGSKGTIARAVRNAESLD